MEDWFVDAQHRAGDIVQQLNAETTLPRVIDPELKRALTTAGRKVGEWTAERDRLIKEAVTAGGSLREVGEAAGVSHTAVKFIAHGRPK